MARFRPVERSRATAMSGIRPTKKKTIEMVMYVFTANTSQSSGLLKFTHRPRWFGYGMRK